MKTMDKDELATCAPIPAILAKERRLWFNACISKLDKIVAKQIAAEQIAAEQIAAKQTSLDPYLRRLQENKWLGVTLTPALTRLIYQLDKGTLLWEDSLAYLKAELLPSGATNEWMSELIELQNKLICRDIGAHAAISLLTEDKAIHEEKFALAWKKLKSLWPEAYEAAESFIKKIVLVQGGGFWSSSVPSYHGAILVCPQANWSLAHYLETLVHESAHLELNIRRMLDPLLLNPQEEAYSSLRSSPRPMLGVLHAVFVLSRTVKMLTLLSQGPIQKPPICCVAPQLPSGTPQAEGAVGKGSVLIYQESKLRSGSSSRLATERFLDRAYMEDAKNLAAEFAEHLQDGLQQLQAKAKFTVVGQQLFFNIMSMNR